MGNNTILMEIKTCMLYMTQKFDIDIDNTIYAQYS